VVIAIIAILASCFTSPGQGKESPAQNPEQPATGGVASTLTQASVRLAPSMSFQTNNA
jgi:hypothetical protein